MGSIALDRCSPVGFLSQLRFGSQVHIWWAELLPEEEEGPRLLFHVAEEQTGACINAQATLCEEDSKASSVFFPPRVWSHADTPGWQLEKLQIHLTQEMMLHAGALGRHHI